MKALVDELRTLQQRANTEQLKSLRYSPYLPHNELAQALYALCSEQAGLAPLPLLFNSYASGAIPFYHRSFFPWGALPYPYEHAELGVILAQLQEEPYPEMAQKMMAFQQATLTHEQKPIHSLFCQERGRRFAELEKVNRAYFEKINEPFKSDLHFIDHELGLVVDRRPKRTFLSVGSGCKSGMGALFYQDSAIVNFGSQLLPLGDCSGFGLAGKVDNYQYERKNEDFTCSYSCRLSASHPKKRYSFGLADSGYSGLWIQSEITGQGDCFGFTNHFEGFFSPDQLRFVFFGKASSCIIANTQRLKPRSLDRYLGPPQKIELRGIMGSIFIESRTPSSQLEVIPLAGDESFWGADFLISYRIQESEFSFNLETKGS